MRKITQRERKALVLNLSQLSFFCHFFLTARSCWSFCGYYVFLSCSAETLSHRISKLRAESKLFPSDSWCFLQIRWACFYFENFLLRRCSLFTKVQCLLQFFFPLLLKRGIRNCLTCTSFSPRFNYWLTILGSGVHLLWVNWYLRQNGNYHVYQYVNMSVCYIIM